VIREGGSIDILVDGKPLEPDTVYRIATTRFLADGGDGMASLAGLARVETLPFTRDVLLEDLKIHSQVRSPGAGRLLIR
jgi:5'-nucleotidase/UDP-sugar diphosphatase